MMSFVQFNPGDWLPRSEDGLCLSLVRKWRRNVKWFLDTKEIAMPTLLVHFIFPLGAHDYRVASR